jgi:hypothetical protein
VTAQPDPYVRVYYSITDDAKFAAVYDDDAALALWLRLLIVADACYPAAAPLPRCNEAALAMLVDAGLVDLVGTTRYHIHGLVKERERRSSNARASANARWSDATAMRPHSTSDATAMRPHSSDACEPMLAEPSLAEPSSSKQSRAEQSRADCLDTFYRLTGSWPSQRIVPWLNEMAADHGEDRVSAALAIEWTADTTRSTLMSRCRDRLERDSHLREKAAGKAAEEREERERKAIEEMPPEQRAANLARLRDEMAKSGLLPPKGEAG